MDGGLPYLLLYLSRRLLTIHCLLPVPSFSETWPYIKNFVRDRDTAVIALSSGYLVRRVCKWVDIVQSATTTELWVGKRSI